MGNVVGHLLLTEIDDLDVVDVIDVLHILVIDDFDVEVFTLVFQLVLQRGDVLVAVDDGGGVGGLALAGVELLPEEVLELGDVESGDGGDEEVWQVGGEVGFQHLHEFVVEEIGLGDGQHALLVEELGVVGGELAQQHFVVVADVIGVAGDHKQEQGVALDMAQKAESEALAFAGALDDAGDVGHDEGAALAVADDAHGGLQRGEGVVRPAPAAAASITSSSAVREPGSP